ncbi:MAG: hypothetical protein EZS28_041585, partial [Streblomastix strix]
YLALGFVVIIIAVTSYQIVCAVLFRQIVASQPWVIALLRITVDILTKILYIPIITNFITTFDCYFDEDTHNYWRPAPTIQCLSGDILQIASTFVSILFLIILFTYTIIVNLFIFPHNPRHGGLFSSRSGVITTFEFIILFGNVFAVRLLFSWPFWRGIVTVGSSLCIVFVHFIYQPYYNMTSNFLVCIAWTLFGSIRLCAEIGYAIELSSHSQVPQKGVFGRCSLQSN